MDIFNALRYKAAMPYFLPTIFGLTLFVSSAQALNPMDLINGVKNQKQEDINLHQLSGIIEGLPIIFRVVQPEIATFPTFVVVDSRGLQSYSFNNEALKKAANKEGAQRSKSERVLVEKFYNFYMNLNYVVLQEGDYTNVYSRRTFNSGAKALEFINPADKRWSRPQKLLETLQETYTGISLTKSPAQSSQAQEIGAVGKKNFAFQIEAAAEDFIMVPTRQDLNHNKSIISGMDRRLLLDCLEQQAMALSALILSPQNPRTEDQLQISIQLMNLRDVKEYVYSSEQRDFIPQTFDATKIPQGNLPSPGYLIHRSEIVLKPVLSPHGVCLVVRSWDKKYNLAEKELFEQQQLEEEKFMNRQTDFKRFLLESPQDMQSDQGFVHDMAYLIHKAKGVINPAPQSAINRKMLMPMQNR